jgi:hypothetical protein
MGGSPLIEDFQEGIYEPIDTSYFLPRFADSQGGGDGMKRPMDEGMPIN